MAFFPQPQPHLHGRTQQQQPQQQIISVRNFVPIDGQMSAAPAIHFLPPPPVADPTHSSFVDVAGLGRACFPATVDGGASDAWEKSQKRRLEERDLLENSQISSIDFLRTGLVSTGLGLSLDDRRGTFGAASSGESPLPLSTFDQGVNREIQRMDAEVDQFIKNEGERLRLMILKKVQAEQLQILASLEEKILKKIREKESEIEEINMKNMELGEQMKQLTMEVGSWQKHAIYNESMINSLKKNLEQLYAQKSLMQKKNEEGSGDSEEVDDTAASCCNGNVYSEQKGLKSSMKCVVCSVQQVSMLLLPCRHLCLCKVCEPKLSSCPLCHSSKFIGMEIYRV